MGPWAPGLNHLPWASVEAHIKIFSSLHRDFAKPGQITPGVWHMGHWNGLPLELTANHENSEILRSLLCSSPMSKFCGNYLNMNGVGNRTRSLIEYLIFNLSA